MQRIVYLQQDANHCLAMLVEQQCRPVNEARSDAHHTELLVCHARGVPGGCRAQLESLQAQLQEEAEARNKMEEEMKRSFMRGMFG